MANSMLMWPTIPSFSMGGSRSAVQSVRPGSSKAKPQHERHQAGNTFSPVGIKLVDAATTTTAFCMRITVGV